MDAHFLAFRWRRRDGAVFAGMLILYGVTRFLLEMARADSPLEFDGLTISQNMSLVLVPLGVAMLLALRRKSGQGRR